MKNQLNELEMNGTTFSASDVQLTHKRMMNAKSIALNPNSSSWAKEFWNGVAEKLGNTLEKQVNG